MDIAIEVVGRRPGEKLHEDLFNPDERPQPTPAEKILRAEREPLDPGGADAMFDEIALLVLEGDAAGARGQGRASCPVRPRADPAEPGEAPAPSDRPLAWPPS